MERAMEKVTTKQAAAELGLDVTTVQYLLSKERLPIGYAIKKEGKKRTYFVIYRGLLDQYKESIGGKK